MRHFKLGTILAAFTLLLVTSCKKDIRPETAAPAETAANGPAASNGAGGLSEGGLEKLKALRAHLPAGYEKRFKINAELLVKQHPQFRDLVNRALAVTPTPCNDNTTLNRWLGGELSDWNQDVIFFAVITGMLDFPMYDALLFENSSANQHFGVNGEYSQVMQKTFRDMKRFWNISSNGIVLAAMHGSMLRDRERVIRIDRTLFGSSREDAEYWADLILMLLNEFPQYRKGDHPIFTFNAFALQSFPFPPVGVVPDKIIMGDGLMHGYTGIGYDDVAPQAIQAHEFGHHIQYKLNLFGTVSGPEATRRTELMADAFSAYYLSHARGATMQWKRVQQFLQVFFNIGDCGFNSNGHHGTPTQRMAAAEWGYKVANEAKEQGHILTAEAFTALFEAQLPSLVKK